MKRRAEVVDGPFWQRYRDDGVELVGTLTANAMPHGLVERRAYGALRDELTDWLGYAKPVDGVLLDLHGAMEVEGIGDGESDLAAAVRAVVGPDVPIVAPLDLHGNLAPALIDAVDGFTALRTAPHRDGEETRHRAVALLLRAIREKRKPVTVMVKPPILLPGENAVTDAEPAKSLYALLPEIERGPEMLDASIMIGCAWTDSPHTSTAALAVSYDPFTAQREAAKLAEQIWSRRAEFRNEAETADLDDAVDTARRAKESPVFISDSGDNVTAGGAGDLPLTLEALLAVNASGALVAGLADQAAVAACALAGVGGEVELALGGKLDAINSPPLNVRAVVLTVSKELAVIRVGGVDAVIAADRRAFTRRADFAAANVNPLAYKIVVVKQRYLFPELREIAPRALMAMTPGFTDLRLDRLPFERLRRPIYPLDPEMAWSPSG